LGLVVLGLHDGVESVNVRTKPSVFAVSSRRFLVDAH